MVRLQTVLFSVGLGIIMCINLCTGWTDRFYRMGYRELSNFLEEEYEATVFTHDKVVVCYVQQLEGWRSLSSGNCNDWDLQNVDPRLCTHIIFAFANVDNLTHKIKLSTNPDRFTIFSKWRREYPHLKILLSIGGSSCETSKLQKVVDIVEHRKVFISSALTILRRYKLDGLDIYFPNNQVVLQEDIENFIELIGELKLGFKGRKYEITAALGPAHLTGNEYHIQKLGEMLDQVHLTSYDYNKPWDKLISHNAPLPSVKKSVEDFIRTGIPAEKLVLGLSTYGTAFQLKEGTRSGPAFGLPTITARGTDSEDLKPGLIPYHKVLRIASSHKADIILYWDDKTKVPFMRNGEFWVSFENPQSIKEKVEIVHDMKLRGAITRSLDGDDFLGFYDYEEEKYPLLKKLNHALSKSNRSPMKRKTPPEVLPELNCFQEMSQDDSYCEQARSTLSESELPTEEAGSGDEDKEDSNVWTINIKSKYWKGLNITIEL